MQLRWVSSCTKIGSTNRKNSLELIELSKINKVSLVSASSCLDTKSIRYDPTITNREYLLRKVAPFLDEYNNDYETPEKEETTNDEPKMVMEDMDTQTSTALVQNDEYDPDTIANKGRKLSQQFCCIKISLSGRK